MTANFMFQNSYNILFLEKKNINMEHTKWFEKEENNIFPCGIFIYAY